MAEALYDIDFPNLRKTGFTRTSEPDYYNCIAFVVGDLKRKWWPDDYPPYWSIDFWPPHAQETLDAFTTALASVGFQVSNGGVLETGIEKSRSTHLTASSSMLLCNKPMAPGGAS